MAIVLVLVGICTLLCVIAVAPVNRASRAENQITTNLYFRFRDLSSPALKTLKTLTLNRPKTLNSKP